MTISREVTHHQIKQYSFIIKVHIFFRLLDNGWLTFDDICRDISMDWRIKFEKNTNLSFREEVEKVLLTEMIEEGEDYLPFLLKGYNVANEDVNWQINTCAYEKIIHEITKIVVNQYHKDYSRIDDDGYPVQYLGPYEITTHIINSYINYFLQENLERYNLFL